MHRSRGASSLVVSGLVHGVGVAQFGGHEPEPPHQPNRVPDIDTERFGDVLGGRRELIPEQIAYLVPESLIVRHPTSVARRRTTFNRAAASSQRGARDLRGVPAASLVTQLWRYSWSTLGKVCGKGRCLARNSRTLSPLIAGPGSSRSPDGSADRCRRLVDARLR